MFEIAPYLLAASIMITPGPNTVIMTVAASRFGIAGGMRVGAGVALGAMAIYAAIVIGVSQLPPAGQSAFQLLAVAGSLYLLWMGSVMVRSALRPATSREDAAVVSSVTGLAFLQVVNPKTWILLTTFAAAIPAGQHFGAAGGLLLILVFCLAPWLALGLLVKRARGRRLEAWVTGLGGASLIVMSALVVAGQVRSALT